MERSKVSLPAILDTYCLSIRPEWKYGNNKGEAEGNCAELNWMHFDLQLLNGL